MCDPELENHIKEFLAAVDERPSELMARQFGLVERPGTDDTEDIRRYVNELKIVYGQGLLDMYSRVAVHGQSVCAMTDDADITEPIQNIMRLVAVDGHDVPKILAGFERAANEMTALAVVQLFATIQTATAGGLARQAERDAVILDFTAYCLRRFPPASCE